MFLPFPLLIYIPFSSSYTANARLIHSLPDDPHAFPKFKVAFLNNLPVLNETAQRWLTNGLHGGEREFLDRPWQDSVPDSLLKEIGDAASSISTSAAPQEYSLEQLKMGPRDSYLCFIPKPVEDAVPPPEVASDTDVSPAHIWSLLNPLAGTCLYHRQGWFTYSYCHSHEIRQFKELMQPNVQSTGNYKPEEDPDSHHFTLGRAPATPEPGAELTLAQQNANTANLELAGSPGSRYLVQRWGGGTVCDKTGKRRETEIQFHCSTAGPDTILFIKEAPTCSYVLVINTPRLCSEPGFTPHRESGAQAQINCREIVNELPQVPSDGSLPDTDYPLKIPRVKPNLPLPQAKLPDDTKSGIGGHTPEAIRKAVQSLLGQNNGRDIVVQANGEDGDLVVELVKDGDDAEAAERKTDKPSADGPDRLVAALKAAGWDIDMEKIREKLQNAREQKKSTDSKKKGRNKKGRKADSRDEL